MTRAQRLRTRRLAVGATLALTALVVLALGAVPTVAQDDAPDAIAVKVLAGPAAFSDDVAVQIRSKMSGRPTDVMNLRDASDIAVARLTIQPGAIFPWHTHPGPVMITVASGDDEAAFVYMLAKDCVARSYAPGQALIDSGGTNVHVAYNPSATTETVVIATFLDADGPLTVPVDGQDELDAKCGIDRNGTSPHNH